MTALSDVLASASLDDLAREATLARTCGHHLAGDVLDALVEMRAPETPDLDCARALRRACVSGSEYQRLAEELDRLRESYRMACRMLRDAEAERDRARELAARLEADGARLRERIAALLDDRDGCCVVSDTIDLDALKSLCDKATPGPWVVTTRATPIGAAIYVHQEGIDETWAALIGPKWDEQSRADAEFVAAARQAIPALIAEIGQLRDGGAS